MDENTSHKLHVLDFIISVLMQHEISFTKSLAKLEELLYRIESRLSEKAVMVNTLNGHIVPFHEEPKEDSGAEITSLRKKRYGSTTMSTPNHVGSLREIEVIILQLVNKGNSIEDIALRLDMNPLHVKQITDELKIKGYLPPI